MSSLDHHARPRVAVSRCLTGDPVRYDGGHHRDAFVMGLLSRAADIIPVCPEVELCMGVPREPISLVMVGGTVKLLGNMSRRDWTDAMTALVRLRARELADAGISGAVLKSRSPSCGLASTPILGMGRDTAARGNGLFTAALIEIMPDLPVAQACDLDTVEAQGNFIERVREYLHGRHAHST